MELRTFSKSGNPQAATQSSEEQGRVPDTDTIELARAGKKPVLKRRFGLVSMMGFSSSIMITWEGMLGAFKFGLNNGGPAGLIYSFFFAWIGTLTVFITMAELASMYPAVSGQYHWASILAPASCKKFLSYITGWVTVVAWIALTTTCSYVATQLIFSTVTIKYPDFAPAPWQGTLLMWAILLLNIIVNTILGAALPMIEISILIVHSLGFFAILIPLVYSAPRGNAHEIFTQFYNLGGWPTTALSFFVGLRGNAIAFLGTDGAVHMSEEVENSAVNVPKAIIYSIMLNGSLGFGMLIAILFSGGDLYQLTQADTNFPYTIIFANALGHPGGAMALASITVFLNAVSGFSCAASASRMLWSFSRDRGVPGWQVLRRVNSQSSIPIMSVSVVIFTAALLLLINIGSSAVFEDIVSLVLEGFYGSYAISVGLLLYRRVRGDISEPQNLSVVAHDRQMQDGGLYMWGPWRLKGWVGIANNVVACAYLLLIVFFGFWPSSVDVTAEDMNYSVVVIGAVVIGSITYYLITARKHYTGPIVELQITDVLGTNSEASR